MKTIINSQVFACNIFYLYTQCIIDNIQLIIFLSYSKCVLESALIYYTHITKRNLYLCVTVHYASHPKFVNHPTGRSCNRHLTSLYTLSAD